MIIEGTAIQGPVHEAKFKIGDVVEHPNFGNSQGTITRVVFAQDRFWYFIQQPDGLVIEEPEEALVLVSSGPQWQTGSIPEPDGPAVLVLEMYGGNYDCVSCLPSGNVAWDPVLLGYDWIPVSRLPISHFTGRWYIQTITLPATSGTGEK